MGHLFSKVVSKAIETNRKKIVRIDEDDWLLLESGGEDGRFKRGDTIISEFSQNFHIYHIKEGYRVFIIHLIQ